MAAVPSNPLITAIPTYRQDASLYDLDAHNDQTIKLYQERLVANPLKTEVTIGSTLKLHGFQYRLKRASCDWASYSSRRWQESSGGVNFGEGEVARMEIYSETADIHKAFVREEVRVNKVVDQETVEAQETIRRERVRC